MATAAPRIDDQPASPPKPAQPLRAREPRTGNHAVTAHNLKTGLVVAEMAAVLTGGDDTPAAIMILAQLQATGQALADLQAEAALPKDVQLVVVTKSP